MKIKLKDGKYLDQASRVGTVIRVSPHPASIYPVVVQFDGDDYLSCINFEDFDFIPDVQTTPKAA